MTATGTNDRCDFNSSILESGFGQACIDNETTGTNAGCDTEGVLTVSPGDLVIVMINDFSTFDGFAFSSEVTFGGGAAAACPGPTVTVVNSTCPNTCGPNTGVPTGGTITISNCPTTATVTQYATSATAAVWTTGSPSILNNCLHRCYRRQSNVCKM
ncbi:MAG: hypothetical protein IPN89_04585 [Saprospiraceae bacterium]|nr:hypothetical protein [Saprospiraceae bacterium]